MRRAQTTAVAGVSARRTPKPQQIRLSTTKPVLSCPLLPASCATPLLSSRAGHSEMCARRRSALTAAATPPRALPLQGFLRPPACQPRPALSQADQQPGLVAANPVKIPRHEMHADLSLPQEQRAGCCAPLERGTPAGWQGPPAAACCALRACCAAPCCPHPGWALAAGGACRRWGRA